MISAPNFCACAQARAVSSSPEIPVGKPKIILDSRARSRLAAGRVGFDDQDIEPFRCAVNGSRKTGRAGPDDHQIAKMRSVDGIVEPEAVGNCLVAGITQHHRPAADQHRHVGLADLKPVEQLLGAGVAIEIDEVMRVAVACQELLHAKGAGAV